MHHHHQRHDRVAERLAVGLGWFSIALGVAEVAAPGRVAQLIGIRPTDETDKILRGYGAREIGVGLAILARPEQARWLWARVAGDVLDMGTLGAAMAADGTDRNRALAATLAVAGVTALDAVVARRLHGNGLDHDVEAPARRPRNRHVRVEKSITINRPVEAVYRFWRNFENFPRFMRHLKSVEDLGNGRTRWRAKAPAGMTVKWDAEILQERENEWIAWRSVEGSQVENSGSVRFQPGARRARHRGARAARVRPAGRHVRPRHRVPLRRGARAAGQDDLRRFKQLVETGEIPISDGPALWRAAQPAKNPDKLRKLAGVQS
jgi:uncharacterized membrane protein